MVSTRPPTSKSPNPFNNPLVTAPKAPITIGIIFPFMFNSFFNSLARSRYLSFFSHSFSFILWSVRTAKSTILQFLSFVDHYYYSLIRAFHVSVSRWFFTGVWVTASLLKSPGFFSVFWPFSIINWYQLPSKVEVLILLFTFFQFYSVVSRDSKVDYFASSLFFWLLLSLVVWPGSGDPFVC